MKSTLITSAADMLTHDTLPRFSWLMPWALRGLKRGRELGSTFDSGKGVPIIDSLPASINNTE